MRTCRFHPNPDPIVQLFFCYPVPSGLGHNFEGWLLCPECKGHYDSQDWEYFKEAINGKQEESGSRSQPRSGFHRASKSAGEEVRVEATGDSQRRRGLNQHYYPGGEGS